MSLREYQIAWDYLNDRPLPCASRKPRIRRSGGPLPDARWLCVGQGYTGFGYSPSNAYANWVRGLPATGVAP